MRIFTCQTGQGDPGQGDIAPSLILHSAKKSPVSLSIHESFGIAELSELPILPASRADHLLRANHVVASDTDVTKLCQIQHLSTWEHRDYVPIDQDQH